MPFADKFNEAAQNAAIRLIDGDRWQELPWLAKLVQQAVRDGVSVVVTGQGSVSTLDLSAWADKAVSRIEESIEPVPIDATQLTEEQLETLLNTGRRTDDFSNLSKRFDPASPEGDKSVTAVASRDDEGTLTVHSVSEEKQDSFESNDFAHVEGYDWRIIVADRLKNHRNSWAEHFVRRPTQEEFENQYRHFEAWTHHVHVNAWVDGEWKTITEEYVPHWSKEKPAESFTTTSKWEDGKGWRIKFWDQRVNRENFVYFDYKPGGITLHKYHNGKQFAVVEQRPEGI